MIENHQDVGFGIQGSQDLGKAFVAWIRGKLFERRHPFMGLGAGQIVNAQMEILYAAIGGAPLH